MNVLDKKHFDISVIDGYNKTFNFIQSFRSSGKTTSMLRKIYKKFLNEGQPSVIIRRNIVDISEQYIDDTEKVINKFLADNEKVKFYYKAAQLKEGVVDIYINEYDFKNHQNPFIRIVALSIKLMRLKSGILNNVAFFMYDEYIIDIYNGEKYLPNEVIKFKELYNTYIRESSNIRCFFLGNIYSIYNPFHDWLKLPYEKVADGCYLTGDNYLYNKYKGNPELIEELKNNPLYKDDPDYTNYALYGIAVNDLNKIIVPKEPQNFKLVYLFKTDSRYIGIFRTQIYNQENYLYWAATLEWNQDYQRLAMCFDFASLGQNAFIPDRDLLMRVRPLKYAMQHRQIAFDNIGTSYALEYIYSFI